MAYVNNLDEKTYAALLAACDDAKSSHVKWVDQSGFIRIDPLPDGLTPSAFADSLPELKLRFETLGRGNGYVGKKAAEDAEYVRQQVQTIKEVWAEAVKKPDTSYYDGFLV